MAKYVGKELERFVKLLKDGKISQREFNKLKDEAINGNGKTKKSQKGSHGFCLAALIFLGVVFGGGGSNSSAPTAEEIKAKEKMCNQSFKDGVYAIEIDYLCNIQGNIPEFQRNSLFENINVFDAINNCKLEPEIQDKFSSSIKNAISTKLNSSANLQEFCSSQLNYFNKIQKKYSR